MLFRCLIIFFLVLNSCTNKEDAVYKPTDLLDPYKSYREGLQAFEDNAFFLANKKFSEAELNFEKVELAAKSAIMSSYCLYGINFYSQALEKFKLLHLNVLTY